MMDSYKESASLLRPSKEEVEVPLCLSYRLLVSLLGMVAMTMCFANQSSMGSTMVCMTDGQPVNISDIDPNGYSPVSLSSLANASSNHSSDNSVSPYRFSWDKETQGWIHSSLFIGYYVPLLPSGLLATRHGGRRVVIAGLFVSSVAQLITPLAATSSVGLLCVVRALCGFASGFIYAPVFGLLANWVPAAESSVLYGVTGTGIELGAVLSFSLSSLVCDVDVIGGWPLTYYTTGVLGLLTTLAFLALVSDVPSKSHLISPRERYFIEDAVGSAGGHGHKDKNDNSPLTSSIPVRRILTSLPVWALVVSQIGSDWLYYLMITVLPNFMEEVMQMSESHITLLTGLPFLAVIPSIYVAGTLADLLRRKQILSTTAVRKSADFLCKILPGALLVGMGFLGPGQEALFVTLYLLLCVLLSCIYVSWVTNPVDLSPAYTGFITSLSETGAMWVAIVVPIAVANITAQKRPEQWRMVFYITGGLQVVTFLFYITFGSSQLQDWGRHGDASFSSPENYEDSVEKPQPQSPELPRTRRVRRSLSPNPYFSDSKVGRRRVYRSIGSGLSDVESQRDDVKERISSKQQPSQAKQRASRAISSSTASSTSKRETGGSNLPTNGKAPRPRQHDHLRHNSTRSEGDRDDVSVNGQRTNSCFDSHSNVEIGKEGAGRPGDWDESVDADPSNSLLPRKQTSGKGYESVLFVPYSQPDADERDPPSDSNTVSGCDLDKSGSVTLSTDAVRRE